MTDAEILAGIRDVARAHLKVERTLAHRRGAPRAPGRR
jgi:hypothetical protein